MFEEIKKYANGVNSSNEVLMWLETTGKKNLEKNKINVSDLEHIIDYLNSKAAPNRLQKMSIKDAKRKANEWSEANKKKGRNLEDSDTDIEMIYGFENGSMIVKLNTKLAFQREGFLMSHCLGGYSPDNEDCIIYSYRDEKNMPHATFEVRKNASEIVQIKGKGNGPIHPNYIEPILIFMEYLDINIRSSDMENLGYHHLHMDHVAFLKNYNGVLDQVVKVRNEFYAC